MTYGEAIRLTRVLLVDPSTAVSASMAGWTYPLSREALALLDLFDLQHASKSKRRPKPYPRPWAEKNRTQRRGTARLTSAELRDVLDRNRDDPPEVTAHG